MYLCRSAPAPPPEGTARNTPASGPVSLGRARAIAVGDVMRDERPTPFVVRADGEIDIATAPRLRRRLAAALEAHREVVLDLSEVTFMDCSGLGVLVQARNQADQHGGRLVLKGAGRPVTRLLKLTGLSRRLAAET